MSLCSALRGRLEGWVAPPSHHHGAHVSSWRVDLLHSAIAALFVASLFHVLQPFLKVLDVVPFIVASPLARAFDIPDRTPIESRRLLAGVALVGISKDDFESEAGYQGVSPLDRQRLMGDLGKLLALPQVRTVAVDLDLSPSARERVQGSARAHQQALDALLDANATRLVLLKPFDAERQGAWMQARMRNGVQFADGEFELSLGVVSGYHHPSSPQAMPLFGEAVARRIGTLPQGRDCHHHECTISFNATEHFHDHGAWLDIARLPDASKLADVRHVIFGAHYSDDDRFLSPVGYLYGMDLHAAVASMPRFEANHGLGFLFDMLFGTALGMVLKRSWRRYFEWKLPTLPAHAGRPALAYWWLLWIGGVYIAVVGLAMALVVLLYTCGVWFSPIGMALGMALDAFVVQGVEEAQHRLEHHGHVAVQAPRSWVGRLLAWLPCLGYVGIVGYVLTGFFF